MSKKPNAYLQRREAVNQAFLDARIKDGCDEFYTFYERYPQLKKLGYDKARKGWK